MQIWSSLDYIPTVPSKQKNKGCVEIQLQPMTREDLPQVLAIERESFPLPFSENLFHMEMGLNIAHMLVAKAGGAVCGYIDYWHVDSEMHVINIAVAPKQRGHGVGGIMMQHLIDYSSQHKVEKIFLDVRESNKAAIGLYKRFGFEQIDVRKGYYEDNEEDALVMVREP